MKQVIIIGAGHAGVQAAASLREEGFDGRIVILSEDPDFPYQKPPLSKGFLQGKQNEDSLMFRSRHFYAENEIELRLGETVIEIDRDNKYVKLRNGELLSYSNLILATGASNRKLVFNGVEPENIYYLRTLADSKAIEQGLKNAKTITVIGGGFIGLELAALGSEKGKKVTVIEAQERLMERVLPAVVSNVFLKRHLENGVKLLCKTGVTGIVGNDVHLTDGTILHSDMIIAGIGVIPETQLAVKAGLTCDNGISVNEYQQTSDPAIYAVGDCANHYNRFAGQKLRLESVQNAVDQARTAASHITGKNKSYDEAPWFWTFQYDLKLQMAGISLGYDNYIVRGNPENGKFSVYYFKNNQLIAVDSLNKPADHLNARKLIQHGISPDLNLLKDEEFKLNELIT